MTKVHVCLDCALVVAVLFIRRSRNRKNDLEHFRATR